MRKIFAQNCISHQIKLAQYPQKHRPRAKAEAGCVHIMSGLIYVHKSQPIHYLVSNLMHCLSGSHKTFLSISDKVKICVSDLIPTKKNMLTQNGNMCVHKKDMYMIFKNTTYISFVY